MAAALVALVQPAFAKRPKQVHIPESMLRPLEEVVRMGAPTSGSLRCQARGTAGIKMGGDVSCADEFVGGHACTVDCCSQNDEADSSSNSSSAAAADQQTVLFLLGFPWTGTSALHFLLATGSGVATLGKSGELGPSKEGWAKTMHHGNELKHAFAGGNFQLPAEGIIPWTKLVKQYHALWGTHKKPILLENSPPEIMHARKLKEVFEKDRPERVKFLVLARQPCNTKTVENPGPDRGNNFFARLALVQQIVKEFGKDVFLLRYEDLCVRPEESVAAIEKWLPKIGKLNVNARSKTKHKKRGHRSLKLHDHAASLTVPEYCKRVAVPSWPVQGDSMHISEADGISGHYWGGESSINDLLSFFGYTPTFNETK